MSEPLHSFVVERASACMPSPPVRGPTRARLDWSGHGRWHERSPAWPRVLIVPRMSPVLPQEARGWSRLLLVLCVVTLGRALQEGNGNLWANAMTWLTLTLVAAGMVLLVPRMPAWLERPLEALCAVVAVLGVALFFTELLTARPAVYLRAVPGLKLQTFQMELIAAAVLGGYAMAARGWGRALASIVAIGAFVALCAWILKASPSPRIDVFLFQKEATQALLDGQSPYAITFADIYDPKRSAQFYGPGLSVGGRLQFGFPYLPLSLLLVLPAQVWADDYRWAQVLALALTALIFLLIAPRSRWGSVAAMLLLFTPRIFFVVEQGWTEPLVVALFALVVLVGTRRPGWLWLPLGLFIAAKQYAFLIAPLALLMLPRPWNVREVWRLAWRSAAVVAVITLPFVAWSPEGFINSVVTLQFKQPFRPDALSVLSWYFKKSGELLPAALAFIAAAVTLALGLWRAERSPYGFAIASGACFITFFAFNKQAFANYYMLVAGILCAAIAAADARRPTQLRLD